MKARTNKGITGLPKKSIISKALPIISVVGIASTLGACSLIDRFNDHDSEEPAQSYAQEMNSPQAVRVMAPAAQAPIIVSNDTQSKTPISHSITPEIKTNHPHSYTVKKGDTLWDISGMFLKDSWLWPKLWDVNPQIKNPHLIYPGDIMTLTYIDGKPTMVVSRDGVVVDTLNRQGMGPDTFLNSRNSHVGGTEKLSPQIHEEPLHTAITTIPGNSISQFLEYPRVVDEATVDEAPYVIGNYEGRLASAAGHQIYVRGDLNKQQTRYGIFRKSSPLNDPDTGERLGYELTHVADAQLLHSGDPATMLITSSKIETIAGDRLLNQNQTTNRHNYVPRVPDIKGEGKIISLFNAINQTGRNQVVVVNMGEREGVQIGDVMAIEHRGGVIRDRFSGIPHDSIKVPNTRIGVMMVFHSYEKVSYGIIMESTRPIHLGDSITGI